MSFKLYKYNNRRSRRFLPNNLELILGIWNFCGTLPTSDNFIYTYEEN